MQVMGIYDIRVRDVVRDEDDEEVYLCGELVIDGVMAGFVEALICGLAKARKIL